MAEIPVKGQMIQRIFEQGPDSVSFYCDLTQVLNTGHEMVFQFYETIPGTPGPTGSIQSVRTRLRATITTSPAQAKNIANNLLAQISNAAAHPEAQK